MFVLTLLNSLMFGDDSILTYTSHIVQSWRPNPPGKCCCPKKESQPSVWPARPVGPAAFGWWRGSPHAEHTGPQAVADCHPPSGLTMMYYRLPAASMQKHKVMMEFREETSNSPQRFNETRAAKGWIIKYAGAICSLGLTSFCTPVIVRLAWRREYVSRFTPSQVSLFP